MDHNSKVLPNVLHNKDLYFSLSVLVTEVFTKGLFGKGYFSFYDIAVKTLFSNL